MAEKFIDIPLFMTAEEWERARATLTPEELAAVVPPLIWERSVSAAALLKKAAKR